MKVKIGLLLGLCLFQLQLLAATTGKIAGKIVDKKTGEELIGVSVLIEGTSIGATTDFEGKFSISNVKPGIYNLLVSYVSYAKKTIKGVEVKAGEVSNVSIVLEAVSNDLSEVVVQGTLKRENASALLIQQKKNISISDGISADMIKKTPDATTGDVMKRVSGTSIQDNKFAVIRGLNDRYNTAYINGAPLPSSESDRKAFSFDIFPSNMLANMVITKTASPDLPGDFAGGLITINTRDIPENKFISVSTGTSIHSITTGKAGLGSNSSSTDWLGFDDGKRMVPDNIPARGEYNNNPNKIENSKAFDQDWTLLRPTSLPVNYSINIAGGNSYKVRKKDEFGFIISASYNNSRRNQFVERNQFNRPMDGNDNQIQRSYQDTITKDEVLTGLMANFGYKLGNNHKISFKNALTLNSENLTTLRAGADDYLSEQVPLVRNVYFNYNQSRLLTNQIIGEHYLPTSKLKIKWVLNNNSINRTIPDFKRFSTSANLISQEDGYTPYAAQFNNTINFTQLGRFYSSLDENIRSASIDVQRPFEKLSGKKLKTEVKVGAFYQARSRDFQARAFVPVLKKGGIDGIRFREGMMDTMFKSSAYGEDFYWEEDFRAQDVYSASSKLAATYLMFDQKIASRFRLVYGVRFESYRQTLSSFELNSSPPKPLNTDTVFNDFLPSMNFTYELTEKTNLRFSASRTLARPEFRELAPFSFYDFNSNTVVSGNPNLTRTRINNYDFRYEYYPGEGQLISASVFYKTFQNPIEVVLEFRGSDTYTSYSSKTNANNYGIEFEVRKNFDFLDNLFKTTWIKNFSFTANYAYIVSKVTFDENVSLEKYGSRPLQGQSPYILNTSLQYYNDKAAFGIAVFVNRIGRRIAFVREINGLIPDLWENPRTVLDISITKRIWKGLDMKFAINDLLAQDLVFYWDNNGNGKLDSFSKNELINAVPTPEASAKRFSMDNDVFRYKMGYTMSFSLSYKF
ncbi:MAG: TonB-dependent receptor [Bacteroidia bacterium]|nr:TonB-dependent receptor [Bacteroidia bacterium]